MGNFPPIFFIVVLRPLGVSCIIMLPVKFNEKVIPDKTLVPSITDLFKFISELILLSFNGLQLLQ